MDKSKKRAKKAIILGAIPIILFLLCVLIAQGEGEDGAGAVYWLLIIYNWTIGVPIFIVAAYFAISAILSDTNVYSIIGLITVFLPLLPFVLYLCVMAGILHIVVFSIILVVLFLMYRSIYKKYYVGNTKPFIATILIVLCIPILFIILGYIKLLSISDDKPTYYKIYGLDNGDYSFSIVDKNRCRTYYGDDIVEETKCKYEKKSNTIWFYSSIFITKKYKVLYWDKDDMIYVSYTFPLGRGDLLHMGSNDFYRGRYYQKFGKEEKIKLKSNYNLNGKQYKSKISLNTKNQTYSISGTRAKTIFSRPVRYKQSGTYKIYKDRYGVYPIAIVLGCETSRENDCRNGILFYNKQKDTIYEEPWYVAKKW